MKNILLIFGLFVMFMVACEYDDDSYQQENFVDAYVRIGEIHQSDTIHRLESNDTLLIHLTSPINLYEDIEVVIGLGGSAEADDYKIIENEDYCKIIEKSEDQLKLIIPNNLDSKVLNNAILPIQILKDDVLEKEALDVEILSAKTKSGMELKAGLGNNYKKVVVDIRDYDPIVGEYKATSNGDLADRTSDVEVKATLADNLYFLNDIAQGTFSAPIEWVFKIRSDDSIIGEQYSYNANVSASVTGSVDRDNNVIILHVKNLDYGGSKVLNYDLVLTKATDF